MIKSETKNACWVWRYSFIYTVGKNTLDEKRTKYYSVVYYYTGTKRLNIGKYFDIAFQLSSDINWLIRFIETDIFVG